MVTKTETTVNGVAFHKWSNMGSSAARRFAADLPRGGHEAIRSVRNAPGNGVDVWLETAPDVEHGADFELPDGWAIDYVRVLKSGQPVLGVEPEGEA